MSIIHGYFKVENHNVPLKNLSKSSNFKIILV